MLAIDKVVLAEENSTNAAAVAKALAGSSSSGHHEAFTSESREPMTIIPTSWWLARKLHV